MLSYFGMCSAMMCRALCVVLWFGGDAISCVKGMCGQEGVSITYFISAVGGSGGGSADMHTAMFVSD